MENPCRKDCPRRSPVCHSSCPDYPKYKKFLERKKALIRKGQIYDEYISIKKSAKFTHDLKESVRKR